MKRNLVRNIVGGLSFSTALFVFQACYGMPQDMLDDLFIEGTVTAESTGLPVEGIKVTVSENGRHDYTDSEGFYSIYTDLTDRVTLLFDDVDSEDNGSFARKDTVLSAAGENFLNVNVALANN